MSAMVRAGWISFGLCLPLAAAAQSDGFDCLIQPKEEVTLSFAVEGVVDEVLVDRGDLVEQGQELARLQAHVERASLQVAQARATAQAQLQASAARLEIAERALARSAKLKDQDIVSSGEMEEVLREQQLAQASVQDAKESRMIAGLESERAAAVLEMRTVRSPIDGVVVDKILSPGEWADPPQILKLAQIDPLQVEVFVPLSQLGRIAVGTSATVEPEKPVGGRHAATVSVVDRVVDAASGMFGVRLELPNPDFLLPAGVKCRIQFEAPEASTASGSDDSPDEKLLKYDFSG